LGGKSSTIIAAREAERKLKKARIRPPELGRPNNWLGDAVTRGVITEQEAKLVEEAHSATRDAIMVDDFPPNQKAAAKKPTRKTTRKAASKADKEAA